MFIGNKIGTSKKDHVWSSKSNVISISTQDKNFIKKGSYFIAVYPDFTMWDRLVDNNYNYMITYHTEDSFIYLYSGVTMD